MTEQAWSTSRPVDKSSTSRHTRRLLPLHGTIINRLNEKCNWDCVYFTHTRYVICMCKEKYKFMLATGKHIMAWHSTMAEWSMHGEMRLVCVWWGRYSAWLSCCLCCHSVLFSQTFVVVALFKLHLLLHLYSSVCLRPRVLPKWLNITSRKLCCCTHKDSK